MHLSTRQTMLGEQLVYSVATISLHALQLAYTHVSIPVATASVERSFKSHLVQYTIYSLTHLNSLPSNFRALVNTTVLAGMFSPRANVSVANSTCGIRDRHRYSWTQINIYTNTFCVCVFFKPYIQHTHVLSMTYLI